MNTICFTFVAFKDDAKPAKETSRTLGENKI